MFDAFDVLLGALGARNRLLRLCASCDPSDQSALIQSQNGGRTRFDVVVGAHQSQFGFGDAQRQRTTDEQTSIRGKQEGTKKYRATRSISTAACASSTTNDGMLLAAATKTSDQTEAKRHKTETRGARDGSFERVVQALLRDEKALRQQQQRDLRTSTIDRGD